jgi:hypothetical protein
MRPLADDSNNELQRVLGELLVEDVDITVREVARRHGTLKNASAFTRNAQRMDLIVQAQQRQIDARNVREGPAQRRSDSMTARLEEQSHRIVELESQVEALIVSHAACIRAVMLHGGMQGVERFWGDYKHIGDKVKALGAASEQAEVVRLRRAGD